MLHSPLAAATRAVLLAIPLLGTWTFPAHAQTAYQVKDINIVGDASVGLQPIHTTRVGDKLFFVGTDEANGPDLWVSDGTASGTHLVMDLVPGPSPYAGFDNFTDVSGTVFFTLRGSLWKSDGTAAGTIKVKPIGEADNFTNVNGLLFFTVAAFPSGNTLWKSDGTAAGTVMVRSVNAQGLINAAGTLFFAGGDPAHGGEPWKSDGTEAGTVLIRDICLGPCTSMGISGTPPAIYTRTSIALGSRVFFAAYDGTVGLELWVTDGTQAGTRLVRDITPGPVSSDPFEFEALSGDRVVFAAATRDSSGYPQSDLWISDGTEGGTVQLAPALGPRQMTRAGQNILFLGNDGSGLHNQLWRTDGTPAGTRLVKQMCTGCNAFGWERESTLGGRLPERDGLVYFAVADVFRGPADVWRSDGTEAGTFAIMRVPVNPDYALPSPWYFANGPTGMHFTASDGTAGLELWKSDGSVAGTTMVRDYASVSSSPNGITAVGSDVFYGAVEPATGQEVWTSDGSEEGTRQVVDLNPGPVGSIDRSSSRASFQGRFLFRRSDSEPGLWRMDGTEGGTYPLLTGTDPVELTVVGDSLLFGAYESQVGALWRSDGTPSGTRAVTTFGSYVPRSFTRSRGLLFFSLGELWRSDGTASGTVVVGGGNGDPLNLTDVQGTLFYKTLGDSTPSDDVLWKSDGTSQGTQVVRSGLNLAEESMVGLGNRLVFHEFSGQDSLWRSDGSSAGTALVKAGVNPVEMLNASGLLFFPEWTLESVAPFYTSSRDHLWKSDGTAAGTVLVSDVPRAVSDLIDVDGTLYFAAYDPEHGRELWKSDGTSEGTVLVQDISPGPASSNPQGFARAGGLVYFSADDGTTGAELWAFPVPPPAVAAMTSPAPATRLPGATVTFTWAPGANASEYWLYVGTTFGGGQILNASQGRNLSKVVSGLPIDGRTVYVRLWTLFGGSWRSVDYTYTAAVPRPATMVSPAPGAALNSSVVTFTWEAGAGATAYWLYVGTTPGGKQIYPGSQVTNLSATVSGVPTTGAPVYVRLFSLIGAVWQHIDYSYTTGAPAVSLTVSATTVSPGQTVQVTLQGGPGNARDWIGLYTSTAADTTFLDWKYLNGTKTIPATGVTSATLTFTMPTTAGLYNLRFFPNGGFTKLATSPTITVGTATNPVLNVTPTSLAFGSVTVGSTLDKTVVVKNTGTGTLAGTGSVTGTGYSIIGTTSYSLTANQEMTLTVRFAPTATGAANGTLTLTGGAGAAVPLTGNGTSAGPSLAIVGGVTTVVPGATVQVQVSNGPGFARDWVGLHAATAADTSYLDWKYLNGTRTAPVTPLTTATLTFTMPTTPGTYNFRFFQNGVFTKLATSPSVTVGATSPVLGVNPTTLAFGDVAVGQTLDKTVTVTNTGGGTLTGTGTVTGTGYSLIGTATYSLTGSQQATLTVRFAPTAAGAATGTLTLTGGAGATVPLTGNGTSAGPSLAIVGGVATVAPGATVQIQVSNGPGLTRDWVGLHATAAADTVYLDWKYLNGTRTPPVAPLTTATLTFTMPTAPGVYNFRFFQNGGFTKLATSASVTVQ